ncbi:MAG: TetR/AcrR family transcriptional regulator [Ruthenibacterium sp.]
MNQTAAKLVALDKVLRLLFIFLLTSFQIHVKLNVVQYEEGDAINTVVTSKEAILSVCLSMAAEGGLQALNMRTVAEKCNISVGSVYNYFPSKADLITAAIREVWQNIFHTDHLCKQAESFPAYVANIFESVTVGTAAYPQFFTAHSLSFATADKSNGRKVMENYFEHMKSGLLSALNHDKNIAHAAFSDTLTQSAFVDFVFSNLLTLWMQHAENCTVLTEILRKVLYSA